MKRILLFVIVFFTVMLQGCAAKNEDTFTAVDGQVDVTEWQAEDSLLTLNGEWEFYWNQLLSPADFVTGASVKRTGLIQVPSLWNSDDVSELSITDKGYATYRLQLLVPEKINVYGFMLPYIYSSYKLWIDDLLVASVGQVGESEESSKPKKYPNVIYFSPTDTTMTLTLQVSNFRFATGGIADPIKFGHSETVHQSYFNQIILQSFMLGVLILSGIYHIGLGFSRKASLQFFYFGAFCLVAALRYMMIGDVFFTKLFPNFPWELGMKLDYISFYSHVPLLVLVFYELYPKGSFKWFTKICISITAIFIAITAVTSANFYANFIVYFQIFMIISAIYGLFMVIHSLKSKLEELYYLLIGIVVLMVTVLVDVIRSLLDYSEWNLYTVGIVVFILSFSLLLSNRFSTTLALSEKLTADLSKLNSELEEKVEKRTEQIQQSNKKLEELNNKLEKMAMVDGLTNIPNRRSFDKYIEEQVALCGDKQTPLSLILVDIDFFKNYNDWYGHVKGDICLQRVAQTLNTIPEGLVARYGGEEFACVLPNKDQTQAKTIARKLNRQVESLQIPHEKSQVSSIVTVSIGVATIIPTKQTSKKHLIKQADNALYQAKTTGKNRVES